MLARSHPPGPELGGARGAVGTCLVVAEQLAVGGSAHWVFQAHTSGGALLLPGLVPATSYHLSLTVLGRDGLWHQAVTLVCVTVAKGEPRPHPQGPAPAFLHLWPPGVSLPSPPLPGGPLFQAPALSSDPDPETTLVWCHILSLGVPGTLICDLLVPI